ncbi:MAG: hypothetical protein ABI954_01340 [Pyrinomonadaceae bacterium]
MFQKLKFAALTFLLLGCFPVLVPICAQTKSATSNKKEKQKKPDKQTKLNLKDLTAEQLAETVILVYGRREGLAAIRKTEVERGDMRLFAPDGSTVAEKSSYERRILRGDNQQKDRIRLDQKLSAAQYALVYDANKIFGIINDTIFVPREEAERGFQASIFHSIDALLRYKENGSTLKMAGKDKQMGVEFFQLDVTDKENGTTRFNISTKLFRVQSLEYNFSPTAAGTPVKYVRKFYDYRNAQGTFVAWRTVLMTEGKPVEETNIGTVTYGAKIEDAEFQGGE